MSSDHPPTSPGPVAMKTVAIVTGASSGLGLMIAQTLAKSDYHVVMVGRDLNRLESAANAIRDKAAHTPVHFATSHFAADATSRSDMDQVVSAVLAQHGRLDVLVNCVGQSDRGLIENLSPDRVHELIDQNVVSALVCSQAAMEAIATTKGSIVNIGSLAAKASPRYLGGYAIAKHALAALTGQLRLELEPRGIHVGLVNPGPIKRSDGGRRYDDRVTKGMPNQSRAPGGGARVKGLEPSDVAEQVLSCINKRKPDVLMPKYMRCMIAIGHAFPRLGDWLLLKFTSSNESDAPSPDVSDAQDSVPQD